MKTTIILTGLFASLMFAAAALSQKPSSAIPTYTSGAVTAGPAIRQDVGPRSVTMQDHTSTFQEGILRGVADVQRSLGDRAYDQSLAAINLEEATSRALDNAKKTEETFFEMRKINREYTAAERGPRLTPEQLARIAKQMTPARLTAYQLNPVSGTVNWPSILMYDEFAEGRESVNKLFANRDASAGLGSPTNRAIVAAANDLLNVFKGHINDMSANEYVVGKRFLDSLAYESQFAPGITVDSEMASR